MPPCARHHFRPHDQIVGPGDQGADFGAPRRRRARESAMPEPVSVARLAATAALRRFAR
jgi:hypothetical protein